MFNLPKADATHHASLYDNVILPCICISAKIFFMGNSFVAKTCISYAIWSQLRDFCLGCFLPCNVNNINSSLCINAS